MRPKLRMVLREMCTGTEFDGDFSAMTRCALPRKAVICNASQWNRDQLGPRSEIGESVSLAPKLLGLAFRRRPAQGVWARPTVVIATLVVVLAVSMSSGIASAQPGFPPDFPADQNQLPRLPREGDLYRALPIPVPDKDPFYRDPSGLASFEPGSIIRSRVVQTRIIGLPVPVFSKQLLFRSNDLHGRAIATATTILIPGIPWRGGARPVVSFQEAIDSADSSCNPSHTLQTGTMKELALTQFWLEQGMAVNIPDFDGKYNTFNTFDEGQMVLDSLRAMKNDARLELTHSGIAMYGFSGGGSGTARAAELRKTYAPDVKILGAAFGGTPADLNVLAHTAAAEQPGLMGISNFTMWLGAYALAKQFPDEFDATKLLNKEGQQILADVGGRCIYTAALSGIYRPIKDYLAPGQSIDTPNIQRVLRSQSLGQHIPDIPILWWNGIFDELIPQSVVLQGVNRYWVGGADLRYYTLPTVEHVVNAAAGWPPAVAWTSAILRGLPPGPKFKIVLRAPLPDGFPGT